MWWGPEGHCREYAHVVGNPKGASKGDAHIEDGPKVQRMEIPKWWVVQKGITGREDTYLVGKER